MTQFADDKIRHPLGMPAGSVRALLALSVLAVVLLDVAYDRPPNRLWVETLLMVLAHYFATRRQLIIPKQLAEQVAKQAIPESHPLYLPRGSIRTIIIVAFAALAYHLYRQDKLLRHETLETVGIMMAYIAGMLLKTLAGLYARFFKIQSMWWLADLRALVVLLTVFTVAGMQIADKGDMLPKQLNDAAVLLALFYFGAR